MPSTDTNTRVIRAADGAGFLVDCGSQHILNELKKLRDSGRLTSLEHIFVTHYHDDHTDFVPEMVREFGATVYACPQMVDILEHPGDYRLPAMTSRSVPVSAKVESGAQWRWKEFQMTLYFFPGQTLYHQALLVEKEDGESIFFIGDSFTPSGIDDYCLLNRDLLDPGMGYFYCLDLLKQIPADCLLVNQHVEPAFRFSRAQIERMKTTLQERVELLRSLVPWDDPNYALDEGWARFRPYASQARPGNQVRGKVVVMNHSPASRNVRIRLNLPVNWSRQSLTPDPVHIPPRQEGLVHFSVTIPENASTGLELLTADIAWDNEELLEWCEMLVEVVR